MEYDVEELEELKRKLNITIPEEEVSKRVNDAYKQLNREMKMPGFRPGKIPQKVLAVSYTHLTLPTILLV